MIEVQKIKVISDPKMRVLLEEIIEEREGFYRELFVGGAVPRIVLSFENEQPFRMRIAFYPAGDKPKMIDVQSYATPDVGLKHGFKKLRRVAKNYFVKNKKRHRN